MKASEKSEDDIAAAVKANTASFQHDIPPEIESGRQLLLNYSNIPPEDVDAHILAIRDKAWTVFPYGCIASFAFLNLTPALQHPLFQPTVARLRDTESTETFLEVGCCLGSVIRQLIAQGVPSERLYGTDLQPHFLDLGCELFRDGNGNDNGHERKSRATFIAGDMLKRDDTTLDGLNGKIDVIYAADFFHLFERHDQLEAAKRMVGFLNPSNPKAMIFGSNEGYKIEGWEKYILTAETWCQMWEQVGEATGTRWSVHMDVDETKDVNYIRVQFTVRRSRQDL